MKNLDLNDPEPIDFIKIEPIKSLDSSHVSKSSAIFHPAKYSKFQKNKPLLICLILAVLILSIMIVLILIPVYLSKSKESMDLDFELVKSVDFINPSENRRIVLTEQPIIPEHFFTTAVPTMPPITAPAVIPEFHVIEQRPIEELPNPNLPPPQLKTKLSSSNQNVFADNFFKLNKSNRLKMKNLMESF
ncbi:hypothetical protein BpHYR1_044090 [Brachionus plicatilis]|uniref:Uncharacterized protein n=1 Tax=Brachionus plicatilis TaxID=10195 RepID=A0A3M7RNG4_BRAPC|nr:hypothetical protein BpHYR1_044090 [Brachionus plicatilis]